MRARLPPRRRQLSASFARYKPCATADLVGSPVPWQDLGVTPALRRVPVHPELRRGGVARARVERDCLGLANACLQHRAPPARGSRGALQLSEHCARVPPPTVRREHEHALDLGISVPQRLVRPAVARPPPSARDRSPDQVSDGEEPVRRGELRRVDRGRVLVTVSLYVLPLNGSDEDGDVGVVVGDRAQLQHGGGGFPWPVSPPGSGPRRRAPRRGYHPRSPRLPWHAAASASARAPCTRWAPVDRRTPAPARPGTTGCRRGPCSSA